MRVTVRVLIILCVVMLLVAAIPAAADDSYDLEHDGFSTSYTYNYDYWAMLRRLRMRTGLMQ